MSDGERKSLKSYRLSPDYDRENPFDGDGKNSCPLCHGRGVVLDSGRTPGPPAFRRCSCVRATDIAYNVENGWKGLMRAEVIDSSPLLSCVRLNLWITATIPLFRKHLKHVAIRQGPRWFFRVVTDADLMTAWLATVPLSGGQVYDPDVASAPVSMEFPTLVDLVDPPELLIILLGAKRASNREMPSVLEEALHHRFNDDKQTWIFDQPYESLREGHRCFSLRLLDFLEIWEYEHLELEEEDLKYGSYQELDAEGNPEPLSQDEEEEEEEDEEDEEDEDGEGKEKAELTKEQMTLLKGKMKKKAKKKKSRF